MKVKKVNMPEDTFIAKTFNKIDYSDAFMVENEYNNEFAIEDVVKTFFQSFENWINWLLYIRNVIVKPLGLKADTSSIRTGNYDHFKGEKGEFIDFFEVYERSDNEIMLGLNDKHLNARASFILKKKQNAYIIMLVTAVHFNYWLGRTYFIPVKPLHKIIVQQILKNTSRKLTDN